MEFWVKDNLVGAKPPTSAVCGCCNHAKLAKSLKFPKFPIIEINRDYLDLSRLISIIQYLYLSINPDYFAGLAATVAGTVTSFTVFTRRRAAR